ncbi:MAG: hypothetical protein AAGE01_22630, partial [Pseudomonadota bacterium]
AQSLRFDTTVVADPGGVLAAVAVAAEGTLTFELTGAIGQALVEVVLIDDGGTAAGGLDRSPAFELRIEVTPAPQIDLAVAIDDDREQVGVNGMLRYHASIENRGPDDAPAAILTVDVSPLVRTTAAACEAMGGTVCPDDITAGGAVDLPAGGRLDLVLDVEVVASPGSVIETRLNVRAPDDREELAPADNDGFDRTVVDDALFASSFEGGEP